MALRIARFVHLLCAAVLVGNEFGSWAAMQPALATLPSRAYIEAQRAITHRYSQIMPAVMTAPALTALPVLALVRDRRSLAFRGPLGGLLCFLAMLLITVAGNAPINRQVVAYPPDGSVEEFYRLRARWDRLHNARIALDVAGFCLVALGALAPAGPERD
jgi:hypothetical protein